MTKRDLIHFRDIAVNGELKKALRFAINRIEELEKQIREMKMLAGVLQRMGKED